MIDKRNAGWRLMLASAALITVGYPAPFASPELPGSVAEIEEMKSTNEDTSFEFELSKEYRPDFERPRRYSPKKMENLAQEVLAKVEKKLGNPFNRKDPHHVWVLAEFFALTPRGDLDPYSTPMEEPDIYYFSEVDTQQNKELYPINANDLVIRFYWEGLTRVAAAYYKLEVVNDKRSPHPQKSRGKVSDVATTAMFDKRPGMSVAEAMAQDKERYDLSRLIQHLKIKGLPTRAEV